MCHIPVKTTDFCNDILWCSVALGFCFLKTVQLLVNTCSSVSCVQGNGDKQEYTASAGLSFNFLPTIILRAYAPV